MDHVTLAEHSAAAFRRGDVGEALKGFRILHAAAPDNAQVSGVLALLLFANHEWHEALDLLVTLPASHDSMLAASKCAQALGDMVGARHFAERAHEIEPSTDARLQLASLRTARGMLGLRTERHPEPHEARDELPCFTLLRDGRLHEGLAQLSDTLAHTRLPGALLLPTLGRNVPRWAGNCVEHLVVILNEGFGDAIQWSRYLAAARERCGRLSVVALAPLHGVLEFDCVTPERMDDALSDADAYTVGALLPLALGADYAPAGDYLRAVPLILEGFTVGVCWAGNCANPTDEYRSASPSHLEPLRAAGARFVSLMLNDEGRPDWIEPPPIALTDFAATARVVASCDLVISVDTSVAHLAGALGVPAWIALASSSCWRWQRHPTRTSWYDSATLWRQEKGERWRDVFERMVAPLMNLRAPWAVSVRLLTDSECDEVLRLCQRWAPGLLSTGEDRAHRHCDEARIEPPRWLLERLAVAAVEADRVLGTGAVTLTEMMVARYTVGEFFNWHRDTGPTNRRALSCTIQLSDDYAGGELRVMRPDGPEYITASADRGVATFFAAHCLHEVAPIVRGTRYAAVLWFSCGTK